MLFKFLDSSRVHTKRNGEGNGCRRHGVCLPTAIGANMLSITSRLFNHTHRDVTTNSGGGGASRRVSIAKYIQFGCASLTLGTQHFTKRIFFNDFFSSSYVSLDSMEAIYLIKIKPYSCVRALRVWVWCRDREATCEEMCAERILSLPGTDFFYYFLHRRRFRHLSIDEREHFA